MPKQKYETTNDMDQESIELLDTIEDHKQHPNKRTLKKRRMNFIKNFLKTSKSRLGRSVIKLPQPSTLTRRKSSIVKSPKSSSSKNRISNNDSTTTSTKSTTKSSQSQQNRRSQTKTRRKHLKRNLRSAKSRDLTHLHLVTESNFRPKTDVVYSSLIFRHIPYNWINDEDDYVDSIKFVEQNSCDSLISIDDGAQSIQQPIVEINNDSLITLESIQNEFNNVYQKDIFGANFKPNNNNDNINNVDSDDDQ